MTEKQIESQILTWLNFQAHIFAFKINTVGIYDPIRKAFRKNLNPFLVKGTSDILGIAYQKMIAIEVKTPLTIKRFLNHPTERDLKQMSFLERVKRYGGCSCVVSSLDQVIEFVSQIRPT